MSPLVIDLFDVGVPIAARARLLQMSSEGQLAALGRELVQCERAALHRRAAVVEVQCAHAAEFFAATAAAMQAAWDKKAETHRRVSVQHGATHLGRVEKWVRK